MPRRLRTLSVVACLGCALVVACGSDTFSAGAPGDSGVSADSGLADEPAPIDSGADTAAPSLIPDCPPLGGTYGADTFGTYTSATGTFTFGSCFGDPTSDGTHTIVSLDLYGFSGDWQGTGVDLPGVYNRTTGIFRLAQPDDAGGDLVFQFGGGGAKTLPLAGDWNGDSFDTIGFYDVTSSTFFLNDSNTSGASTYSFQFGDAKDAGVDLIPIVGDWDGDGKSSVGLYDADLGKFYLRNVNAVGAADSTFVFGAPHRAPLAGDWDGDHRTGVGTYDPTTGEVELTNVAGAFNADYRFTIATGLNLVVGDWDGK